MFRTRILHGCNVDPARSRNRYNAVPVRFCVNPARMHVPQENSYEYPNRSII